MKLKDLLTVDAVSDARFAALDLAGVSADSRTVGPGDLFVALAGSSDDGLRFVGRAVASGAAAVMAERDPSVPLPDGVAFIKVGDARRALALAAAKFFPGQPETIAAVTGTSGKTSVAAFTRQILVRPGQAGGEHRHRRARHADARDLRLAHHSGPGGAASLACSTRRRRRDSSRH